MKNNEQFIDSYQFHPSMSIPFQASKLVLKCYTTHSKFARLIYSTDIINQTRATVRWHSALVSLVGGTCWQTVESWRHPLLFYVSAAARPQLFLCIIDVKVRIAEVMR